MIKIKKKTMWKIITVTMVALAVSILATVGCGIFAAISDMSDVGGNAGDEDVADRPVITAKKNPTVVTLGTPLAYRSYVDIASGSEITEWTIDDSKVDDSKAGKYTVTYTVTDSAGNKSKPFKLTLEIVDSTYTEEALMQLVEQVAKDKLKYTKAEAAANNYTKEKIVKDIYNFVNDPEEKTGSAANIWYDKGPSNDPNQKKQSGSKNRNGWKTDWVDEAYMTLSLDRMRGDCYSFYSVSKAFFEYFGIDNVGIQRAESSTQGGTHYWQAVKVEKGWYYYDSTRSGSSFQHEGKSDKNACLITEAKLLDYVINNPDSGTRNDDYYVLDKKNSDFFDADDNGGKFPTIETTKLGQ